VDPISAICHTDYKAFHQSGTRPIKAVTLIVLHSTEGGGSAKDVAHYFVSPKSGGSAHLVIDDTSCYRCLPNTVIPWGAPGANSQGFHIEQLGYAAWTTAEWKKHGQMLHRVAYKVALHAQLFKIPLVFVDAAGLRAGHKGVTTHAEVSKAWPNNSGNHHDPGTGYPMAYVLGLARQYEV
jgi:hypothetical protein